MRKLIILVGLIFLVSCASGGSESMGYTHPESTYDGSHIVDRPSSPFVSGLNVFGE